MILETERLVMRPLEEKDRTPLIEMNADPHVMRYFPAPMTPDESEAQFERFVIHEDEHGYSLYAARLKADDAFVGVIGLFEFAPKLKAVVPGTATMEIGWRFDSAYWGKGLAPEGANAWLNFAWNSLWADQVVAITFKGNHPSRRVMEKIGMIHDPEADFVHPSLDETCPVRQHVLYRAFRPSARTLSEMDRNEADAPVGIGQLEQD